MGKPNTEVLMRLIRENFGTELQGHLVFTQWRDGIDIERPRYAIEAFTEAVIENAAALQQPN